LALLPSAAFERAVLACKSYLIALAVVEGHLTVEQAAQAAHVEVQSQIDRWGEVEDSAFAFHSTLSFLLRWSLTRFSRFSPPFDCRPPCCLTVPTVLAAAHDVDNQDVRVRLGAAALLVSPQPQLA